LSAFMHSFFSLLLISACMFDIFFFSLLFRHQKNPLIPSRHHCCIIHPYYYTINQTGPLWTASIEFTERYIVSFSYILFFPPYERQKKKSE